MVAHLLLEATLRSLALIVLVQVGQVTFLTLPELLLDEAAVAVVEQILEIPLLVAGLEAVVTEQIMVLIQLPEQALLVAVAVEVAMQHFLLEEQAVPA